MTLAELDVLEPLALAERHTVVLVDDDPAVLAALRRALRGEPYEVWTTPSPDDALEWVRDGGISLIVVDQRMPGLCGTELAEQVRHLSPRTVRVMLTAYPGNALVRHGLAEEVQWLISKPWNDDALRLALRRLLLDLETKPPPPGFPPAQPGAAETRCVEERGIGPAWRAIGRTFRRVASAAVKAMRWIVGFLWMADAGGVPKP